MDGRTKIVRKEGHVCTMSIGSSSMENIQYESKHLPLWIDKLLGKRRSRDPECKPKTIVYTVLYHIPEMPIATQIRELGMFPISV